MKPIAWLPAIKWRSTSASRLDLKMPNVTYISQTGETTTIDAPVGTTVMENAVKNGIDGIVGECGGAMLCATCHVYVDPAFLDLLDPIGEEQNEMLGATAAERK